MGDKLKKFIKNLFSFFLDSISFNTPKAIVFNISIIFVILFFMPTSELGYLPIKCVFKYVIFPIIFKGNCPISGFFADCDCPFCGLTRAMSRLLHGDLQGALGFNILVIPVFIAMVSVLGINIYKITKQQKHKKQK